MTQRDANLDEDLEAVRLRPNVWPWLIGAALNLAVAIVLLGIPAVRGPRRAEAVPARFATFAACFYDAEAVDQPGLGLPAGERTRYASLVLGASPDWPERCHEALEAVPAEESMFLFPSVKNAEAQLRASVALMGTELSTLAERRAAGDLRVSDRPARAMARLRAALAELGLASGVERLSADRDAIALSTLDDVPTASIIPMRVSRGQAWELAVRDGAMLARTMDGRAVVHVRVEAGGIEQRVTRRPRLVSGMTGEQGAPWLVWSTSAATCAASPDGCSHRATGLAALLEDRQTLEPMVWLGAHPLSDRSVHVAGRVAHVVTEHAGHTAVFRFELPEPTVRTLGEERVVPRIIATQIWEVFADAETSLAWITGSPTRLAYAGEGGAGILRLEAGAVATPFDPPVGHHPQVAACGAWIVVVSEGAGVARHESGRVLALEQRVDPPEPSSLRVVCRQERVEVWTLADRTLSRSHCTPSACFDSEILRDDVAAFDALSFDGITVVASTEHADEGLVRVTRLAADGLTSRVPSPCWSDPPDGLCGEPRLATDGTQLVLATRQGEDLRVITSRDGTRFENLIGLEQR